MRRGGTLFALVLASLSATSSARADWSVPAVQFICVPKLGYFSASTVEFLDIDPAKLQRTAALTIMDVADLGRHPYSCRWKNGEIKVRLTYYHTAQPRGFCGGYEYGNMEFRVNDVPVAKLERDYCGRDRQTVEINGFNDIKSSRLGILHCTYPADNDGQVKCDSKSFDTVAKTLN